MLDNDKTLLHLAKNLRHSLTEDQLGAIPVIVPPMDEQQRIADFLDTKCAEIDALTADIQTQIDTLEQYKRSVITETDVYKRQSLMMPDNFCNSEMPLSGSCCSVRNIA